MIHQPLANKKGGSAKAVDYLLNERQEQGTARLLKGNPEITKQIINSITNKQKCTVGVLSFSEANLSEEIKMKMIEEFEEVLLPGLDKSRYNILWVEHTDKGRLELNYVIPKIDLYNKKSFNPYFDKADRTRITQWRDIQNLKYNLSNPNDLARKQTLNNDKRINLIADYKELDRSLHELVRPNEIESREQLIELLNNSGIQVTRQGKDYMSIKLPESKKAKKFKGGIYSEQFTSIKELERQIERTEESIREQSSRDTSAEIRELREKLNESIKYKIESISERNARTDNVYQNKQSNKESNNSIISNNSNNSNDKAILSNSNTKREERTSISNSKITRKEILSNTQEHSNNQRRIRLHRDKGLEENDNTRITTFKRDREFRKKRIESINETRESRIKLYKSITKSAESLREQSKRDSRELSKPFIRDEERLLEKASSNFRTLNRFKRIGKRIGEKIEEFGSQFNKFRERCTSAISSFRTRTNGNEATIRELIEDNKKQLKDLKFNYSMYTNERIDKDIVGRKELKELVSNYEIAKADKHIKDVLKEREEEQEQSNNYGYHL